MKRSESLLSLSPQAAGLTSSSVLRSCPCDILAFRLFPKTHPDSASAKRSKKDARIAKELLRSNDMMFLLRGEKSHGKTLIVHNTGTRAGWEIINDWPITTLRY